MKYLCRLLLLAALTFAVAQAAGEAPVTHDFLAPAAVDFHVLLTPPPAADTIAARGEQELMRHLQAVRTPEQAALAKYYEPLDVFRMLAPVLGAWCTAENLPRTAAIFRQVQREARPTINATKAAWNRLRPYIFDSTLQPAVDRPNNTSYPSGHSSESALYALILSAALPDHAADWQHQAMLVRWSRIIGGAHYPSDTIAGQILGEALGRAMLQSPKLQQALEEIRAEIASHQQKKAA
jgi:acid phosphatase (class A)